GGVAGGDFNNDGFDDLAIGVPGEHLPGSGGLLGPAEVGVVHVLYGSASGLTGAKNQVLQQGGLGTPEDRDRFGVSLAAGDFNDDGITDLAVGVPGEDIEGVGTDLGEVDIFRGTSTGLGGIIFFVRPDTGGGAIGPSFQGFGETLAVGDFDNNGRDDLAVGSPAFDSSPIFGVVRVFYDFDGSSRPQFLSTTASVPHFGDALAAGDFDGDGVADLAIGEPVLDVGGFQDSGAVTVLYGSQNRLAPNGVSLWHQAVSGVKGLVAANNQYGAALTAGDFNHDGRDDLAIGLPGESSGRGGVNVLYGAAGGLSAINNQLWEQGQLGLVDFGEAGDSFGRSLIGSPDRIFALGAGLSGAWSAPTQRCRRTHAKVQCFISADLVVFNPGSEAAAPSILSIFLSKDAVLNPFTGGDRLVKVAQVKRLKAGESQEK